MQTTNTRLIVKNLPKHVDERRLRQHFSDRGDVTDAKVIRTKDGQSRQFAFVGFASESDAKEALSYYNSTFLDTSRIQVESAQPNGDPGIARPWSKHSDGSSRAQRLAEAKRGKNKCSRENDAMQRGAKAVGSSSDKISKTAGEGRNGRGKGDVGKEEFMAALKKRSEARFWDNDDALQAQPQPFPGEELNGTRSDEDSVDEGNLDGYDGGQEQRAVVSTKRGNKQVSVINGKQKRLATVSDMDWLRSKVTDEDGAGVYSRSEKDTGDEDEEADSDPEQIRTRAQPAKYGQDSDGSGGRRKSGDAVGDACEVRHEREDDEDLSGLSVGRLFVRNLPYVCTEDDLRGLFEGFGVLSEVHLPVDEVNKGKGFAFVQFVIPEDAKRAMEQLDKHAFRGRLLHIIPARKQPGTPVAGGDLFGKGASAASKSYKEQKEDARKARAGDIAGWNASFVRADTVVDALADRLGVGKGDILDREEGDMAVRLALGETHLLKENKDYFELEGVDLNALESSKAKGDAKGAGERSKTVILVKNLPFSTEATELAKLFGAFGDVGRVLLPPSKAVALVEFLVPGDARRAFKRLAYTRFEHVPLYLEWAPLKAFKETFIPSSKPVALLTSTKAATEAEAKVDDDEVEVGRASEEPLTLFVKNVSFSTKEPALRACFERAGLRVRSVSIPRKKGKGASEAMLSTGIAFVECADASLVDKALKSLQGTVLDGHALELKRSTKRLVKIPALQAAGPNEAKLSKLIIRNVPFQATAKELRDLFSSFGQLKRVRLPKKFDGRHRGFAFVDFLTPQEAMSAKISLASTHFYGRHLVGEWAEDKEDVDTLRAKAARDVRSAPDGRRSAKRQKAGDGDDFADMDG